MTHPTRLMTASALAVALFSTLSGRAPAQIVIGPNGILTGREADEYLAKVAAKKAAEAEEADRKQEEQARAFREEGEARERMKNKMREKFSRPAAEATKPPAVTTKPADGNYPDDQRGRIYSDDIEAVRREQGAGTGGPALDPGSRSFDGGRHVDADEGRLQANAEINLLRRQVASAAGLWAEQLNTLTRARAHEQIQKGLLDVSKSLYKMDKSSLDSSRNEYERLLARWRGVNPRCDNGHVYEQCNCDDGRASKSSLWRQLESARAAGDRKSGSTDRSYGAYKKAYDSWKAEADQASLADKRLSQTKARQEKLEAKLKRLETTAARTPKGPTTGARIEFDDDRPKQQTPKD